MRIQHNIAALNANRMLAANNNTVSKNLEKLSSGYKINRAGDDAAGLAISEKMRGQIRGLDQAANNANDGISLVQTAEGSLNETASILQRMKELATQSSNGTYQNQVDRENISKEVTSLKTEIDRISSSTNFNKINLLDGSLSSEKSGSVSFSKDISALSATGVLTTNEATKGTFDTAAISKFGAAAGDKMTYTLAYTDAQGKDASFSYTLEQTDGTAYDAGTAGAKLLTALKSDTNLSSMFDMSATAAGVFTFDAKEAGAGKGTIKSLQESVFTKATAATVNTDNAIDQTFGKNTFQTLDVTKFASGIDTKTGGTTLAGSFDINGHTFQFVKTGEDTSKLGSDVTAIVTSGATPDGADMTAAVMNTIKQVTGLDIGAASATTGTLGTVGDAASDFINIPVSGNSTGSSTGLTLQIGATGSADQRVSLSIGDMSSKGLNITKVSVASQEESLAAIKTIDNAINQVSGTRADLGALQNRLEHTVSNLGVTSENLTSAESRIRDVDMAKEMMEMTKNNVLASAAQSMLAQANTQPQNVLKLLQ